MLLGVCQVSKKTYVKNGNNHNLLNRFWWEKERRCSLRIYTVLNISKRIDMFGWIKSTSCRCLRVQDSEENLHLTSSACSMWFGFFNFTYFKPLILWKKKTNQPKNELRILSSVSPWKWHPDSLIFLFHFQQFQRSSGVTLRLCQFVPNTAWKLFLSWRWFNRK